MKKKIGEEYIELTKYENMPVKVHEVLNRKPPPVRIECRDVEKFTDLPVPEKFSDNGISLRDAISRRRSFREYSGQPVTQEELSYLLWATQGIRKIAVDNSTLRTVPSAGACHEFETFMLINNVAKLEKGLYWFLARERKLAKIRTGEDISRRFTDACLGQEFVNKSAVTFAWVAVAERMTWRYGQRGVQVYPDRCGTHMSESISFS
ncbi:MAG: SagB/ThcOx family dehydrogenase [Elusimicrobiota bacterium]